jgi:hypothetical protein
MGEYEPDDSRIVTNVAAEAPGEPPRTGPREAEARARAASGALAKDNQGVADAEPADKPTARDAHGKKQTGFAAGGQQAQQEEDVGESDEDPPLGK